MCKGTMAKALAIDGAELCDEPEYSFFLQQLSISGVKYDRHFSTKRGL